MRIFAKCSLNRLSHLRAEPFLLFVTGCPVTKTASPETGFLNPIWVKIPILEAFGPGFYPPSLAGRYLSVAESGEPATFLYGLIDLIITIATAVL